MKVGGYELPFDIIECILSFLHVRDLCRVRTVCKRWNLSISNANFSALQQSYGRQTDACFIVARYIKVIPSWNGNFSKECYGWAFLDLNAKQWYTVIVQDRDEVFDHFRFRSSIVTQAGLVCEVFGLDYYMEKDVSIFISNPIGKASRRLPSPPCPFNFTDNGPTYRSQVNMVVDCIGHNYKVFVMPNTDDSISKENPLIHVYEWTTNRWRKSSIPSMRQISKDLIVVKCSVSFNGMLYLLVCSSVRPTKFWGTNDHWLWSYNHIEDTWNDYGFNFQLAIPNNLHLFVSGNRLFLGAWLRRDYEDMSKDLPTFEVTELYLMNQTCKVVFQLTMNKLEELFNIKNLSSFEVCASGFKNSIVLWCNLNGASQVYDLRTCRWNLLPKCPVNLYDMKYENRVFYGNPMQLTLPTSTICNYVDVVANIGSV